MYNRLRCIGAGTEGSGSMRELFGKPRRPRTGAMDFDSTKVLAESW
jgi:hypothetical protein